MEEEGRTVRRMSFNWLFGGNKAWTLVQGDEKNVKPTVYFLY